MASAGNDDDDNNGILLCSMSDARNDDLDHDDDDIDSSSSCCAQCLLLGLEPFGKMSHAPLLSPSLGCYIINIIIIIIVIIPIVIIIIITTLMSIFTRGAFSSRQLFLLNSGFFIFPPLLLMKESRWWSSISSRGRNHFHDHYQAIEYQNHKVLYQVAERLYRAVTRVPYTARCWSALFFCSWICKMHLLKEKIKDWSLLEGDRGGGWGKRSRGEIHILTKCWGEY